MRTGALVLGTGILLVAAGVAPAYLAGRASNRGPSSSTERGGVVTETPVRCTLSETELNDRRTNLLDRMKVEVVETRALESGVALRFAPRDGLLEDLAATIEAERKCCAFLSFKLEVTPDNGPIWLELTGPEGTKALLASALGLPE